jgi:ADP-heptose:LPS heptosyltransferase
LQEEKILIIKFGGLGDIILSLDAIFSIFSHHRNNKIILLTEKPFVSILAKTGFFEEVLSINRSLFYFIDIKQIRKKTLSYNFSHVYDLQTSRRSSYYLKYFFKKGSITNGIGKYAKIKHLNCKRNFMHTIDRQKEQMELSDIKFSMMDDYEWLCDKNINIPNSKFALIVPGAQKVDPTKEYQSLYTKKL